MTGTKKIFGTDGVRGVANVEPVTAETALKLGRAAAHVFTTLNPQEHPPGTRPKIVLGKDTRLSGYMFEQAISAGIASMGADVLLVGPLPTPAIAFLTVSMRADAGVRPGEVSRAVQCGGGAVPEGAALRAFSLDAAGKDGNT